MIWSENFDTLELQSFSSENIGYLCGGKGQELA
ncbi:hypothetical protein ROS217_07165 [Roseovarius sp. 217]|nr:hypothetical protein ROS217_07165 [Roseovarius sp. 217]